MFRSRAFLLVRVLCFQAGQNKPVESLTVPRAHQLDVTADTDELPVDPRTSSSQSSSKDRQLLMSRTKSLLLVSVLTLAVAACGGVGDSGASQADVTPPTIPTGLVATAAAGPATINLTWTASTDNVGVTGYIVKRDGVQVATPSATNYADAGLSVATTYSYTVAARDAAGNVSLDSTSASATTADTLFPLRIEAGKRYLVDAAGKPFLMLGESPQAMIGNLTEAEAELFLVNRKSHGFNTVWVNLLCASYNGCKADGTTFDDIAPFTIGNDLSTYDLSAPNEAYFARADRMLQLAAKYGFLVILDPAETGSWLSVLQINGLDKSRAYGQYLGARYKDFPNIVWMSGNDFQDWRTSPSEGALVQAVAQGIKDTDPNYIHTVELDYRVSSSLDDLTWAPIISLNAAYTYYPT